MKHIIKMIGVIGILGAVYLAPSVKVSATTCSEWSLSSSEISCENGLKMYSRTLSRLCSTPVNNNANYVLQYNYDKYVIGTC